MKNQPTKCAITGKDFKDGDLYMEEPIQSPGEGGDTVRYVSPEGLKMSNEDIDKAKEDGRLKTWHAGAERDTRGDGATGPRE